MVKNKNEDIDSCIEEFKLKQCQMFTNRGFMVAVLDSNGKVIFSPYMVSNFSIDKKKIFITLYDLIQHKNIEETLDELSQGFLWFKPQLEVVLIRLDSLNNEVYSVKYQKCKLKKYHGKNFTYKGNEPHQWYLELSFCGKEILKNKDFNFVAIKSKFENIPTQEELNNNFTQQRHKRYIKKEAEILKNSNKMLDEAAEKIKNNKMLTESDKKEKLNEISVAKSENEKNAMKYLNVNINYNKLKSIEKDLVEKISDLEK